MMEPASNTALVVIADPADADLRALVRAVRHGAEDLELASLVRAARRALMRLDVDPLVVDSVHIGLTTGDWTAAGEAFGATGDSDTAFYLGPIRPREGVPGSMSVVLARRNFECSVAFEALSPHVADLGNAMFGFPCSFRGRRVEFFNIELAAGGIVTDADAPIALFTPFYLDGATPSLFGRRTLIWADVVRRRFDLVARAAGHGRVQIDGSEPRCFTCTPGELSFAIGLWLSLHELFHASGPLPLFEPASEKHIAGALCGVLEEARVEMSAWIALNLLGGDDPAHRTAREIIVAERLLRSARRGASDRRRGESTLDGEHGLVWAGVAAMSSAITTRRDHGMIDVDSGRLDKAVHEALREIYQAESAVSQASEGRRQLLENYAQHWTERWLDSNSPGEQLVAPWIEWAPVGARLVSAPSPGHGKRV